MSTEPTPAEQFAEAVAHLLAPPPDPEPPATDHPAADDLMAAIAADTERNHR